MKKILAAVGVIGLAITLFIVYQFYQWTFCRIFVEEGQSLMVRYRGPLPIELYASRTPAKPGHFAQEGEVGVRQHLLGPGRHFYNPLWYETTVINDTTIGPGQVGIVTSRLGDPLPPSEYLVEGNIGETQHKGLMRKVLSPGTYRLHPYAYEVKVQGSEVVEGSNKHFGWVEIPSGSVGVVTNLADNPEKNETVGIQQNVLPPGLYLINGKEKQVDIVEIGYRELTIAVKKQEGKDGKALVDASGEPIVAAEDGVNFPSSDGFTINMDYTAVWGIMPDQAAHAVATFGNVEAVENKVVSPQIESICRNNGSRFSAAELLVGEGREEYQRQTLEDFQKALETTEITLMYGLVRHIYIPVEVRVPIQKSFIAQELTLTKIQEQETAKAEGMLKEAQAGIDLAKKTVEAETTRLYETKKAAADRAAKKIEAEGKKLVASIELQTAEGEADAAQILGQAEAEAKQMLEEAKAGKFKLAVEAFGTPQAYNNWTFATALPEKIDLKLIYAGEGTLWTDAKNLSVIVPQKPSAPVTP